MIRHRATMCIIYISKFVWLMRRQWRDLNSIYCWPLCVRLLNRNDLFIYLQEIGNLSEKKLFLNQPHVEVATVCSFVHQLLVAACYEDNAYIVDKLSKVSFTRKNATRWKSSNCCGRDVLAPKPDGFWPTGLSVFDLDIWTGKEFVKF